MTELKPCPFCGGKAKIFAFSDGGICVKCLYCWCQTHTWSDYSISEAEKESAFERAVDSWNRRKGEQHE